jgi:hypothetical protein
MGLSGTQRLSDAHRMRYRPLPELDQGGKPCGNALGPKRV